MPSVRVEAFVEGGDPDAIFTHVRRFEDYPKIAHSVRDVTTEPDGDAVLSSWEVNFRKGIMKWQERDRIDAENRRIAFEQISGDLLVFVGDWVVAEAEGGTSVVFDAEFDLGIPSLATMLDPVATRTLESNVRELVDACAQAAGTPIVRYAGEAAATTPVGQ